MKCRNCGGEGPHFVPPGGGDPGFYSCSPRATCQTCDGAGFIESFTSGTAFYDPPETVPCPTCGEHVDRTGPA